MRNLQETSTPLKTIKHEPLLDEKQYDIWFMHSKHGQIVMSACINPLNGGWMWWFDIEYTMSAGNKHDVNNILKGIRDKMEVLKDTFWK